jgi:hypothetical protein
MRQWVNTLKDVDAEGLPRSMVRANWVRLELILMLIMKDGELYLESEVKVFEYDPATDHWSKFRCMCTLIYKPKKQQ